MLADLPTEIILDAGPLIGLLDRDDGYHADACRGFAQLAELRTQLVAPMPIVFEVFKWLAYKVGATTARKGLVTMREACCIHGIEPTDLDEVAAIVEAMPRWSGSLEDAMLAVIGLRRDVPVWTLNYRDLAAFPNLRFWTPA